MTSEAFAPVADVLRELHARDVPFVLLRYSPTWSPKEHELDVLVPARTKDSFVRLVLAALPPEVVVIAVTSGLTGLRILLLPVGSETTESIALALDIRESVRKDEALLADFERLTATGIGEEDDLPVLRAEVEAAFLVARNTWAGRTLSTRHHEILRRTWSPRALDVLPDLLVASCGDNYQQVAANAERAPLPGHRRASSPLTKARILLRHATPRSTVRGWAQPPSVLAIHGPDGAGKSTTAALVADLLRARGMRVLAQHYTTGEIDSEYVDRQHAKAARLLDLHAASPPHPHASLWERCLRLALFPVRHLQFQADLRRKRGVDVVIYDRYVFDHLFKEEAGLAISSRVRRAAARVARFLRSSRRTVNVVLQASPAVIQARKAEMSTEQIAEYYATSRIYFNDDASWVNVEPSPTEVADTVSRLFVEEIATKVGRNWLGRRSRAS